MNLVCSSELLFGSRDDVESDKTITPMRFANVVALDGPGARRTVRMRWGLVPADALDPMGAKPYIHARAETVDDKPMAIAVIWERWSGRDEGAFLSFAVMAGPANPLIATIADRMPAQVEDGNWAMWLGKHPATPDELKGLLRPSTRNIVLQG